MTEQSDSSLVYSDEPRVERTAEFIAAISTPTVERRVNERVSVCRPVTLYVGDSTRPMPAVLRDISINGVGLLHDFHLEPCEVTIRISDANGDQTLCARVGILWCKEAARHYYISGGTFLRVFEQDPIKLTE